MLWLLDHKVRSFNDLNGFFYLHWFNHFSVITVSCRFCSMYTIAFAHEGKFALTVLLLLIVMMRGLLPMSHKVGYLSLLLLLPTWWIRVLSHLVEGHLVLPKIRLVFTSVRAPKRDHTKISLLFNGMKDSVFVNGCAGSGWGGGSNTGRDRVRFDFIGLLKFLSGMFELTSVLLREDLWLLFKFEWWIKRFYVKER